MGVEGATYSPENEAKLIQEAKDRVSQEYDKKRIDATVHNEAYDEKTMLAEELAATNRAIDDVRSKIADWDEVGKTIEDLGKTGS